MIKILYQEEVAEMLRRPLSTLRYWRVTGDGPKSFKLGGRVVYKLEDVERWIEAQYSEATPEATPPPAA
jgi:predicted DNA-binding transcriptional regulator AlpA